MSSEYLTIKKEVITTIEIEKSKFICYLSPCKNEEEAKAKLKEIHKAHPKATHHCYAYIYDEGRYYKSNDDGEPSGTAGIPMLTVLKGRNFNNVIAVVIRYFGGILLGRGGLVRAYTQSVEESIKYAVVYKEGFKTTYSVTIDLSFYNLVNQKLNHPAIKIINRDFNEKVTITLILLDEFDLDSIIDLTNGNAIVKNEGSSLYTYKI